jgi:hypothetical protein
MFTKEMSLLKNALCAVLTAASLLRFLLKKSLQQHLIAHQ